MIGSSLSLVCPPGAPRRYVISAYSIAPQTRNIKPFRGVGAREKIAGAGGGMGKMGENRSVRSQKTASAPNTHMDERRCLHTPRLRCKQGNAAAFFNSDKSPGILRDRMQTCPPTCPYHSKGQVRGYVISCRAHPFPLACSACKAAFLHSDLALLCRHDCL